MKTIAETELDQKINEANGLSKSTSHEMKSHYQVWLKRQCWPKHREECIATFASKQRALDYLKWFLRVKCKTGSKGWIKSN